MKKILLIASFLLIIFSFPTYAATVKINDAQKNTIDVSGTANAGETVSVMMLNPGFAENDILTKPQDAIQFYGKTVAENNNTYSITIGMKNLVDETVLNGGGMFTLLVSTSDMTEAERSIFNFFFYEKKMSIIEALNNAGTDIADEIYEAYKTYSLSESELYKKTSVNAIAAVLSKMTPFERDADAMYLSLQKALVIAAFNEGNDALVADGELTNTDIIGVSGTEIYKDYSEGLSVNGKTAVNTGIMKKGYYNTDEIAAEFKNLVLLNLVVNYGKELGYGHIEKYFEKYREDYISAGLNVDKLKKVNDKNSVYLALKNSGAKTMKELISKFNEIVGSSSTPENKPAGGGGEGTVGSGKISSSGVSDGTGFVTNPDAIVLPFDDVESAPWAKEAIAALYKIGVISGKSKNIFAPNDVITREEFTKMVFIAFFGEPENTECGFTDVSGWSKAYIASAAQKGIVSGTGDGKFNPTDKITREQAAAIILRALKERGFVSEKTTNNFSDKNDISDWAKESIGILAAEGVLNGRDNNMFCPKEALTRAETAKIVYYSIDLLGGEK